MPHERIEPAKGLINLMHQLILKEPMHSIATTALLLLLPPCCKMTNAMHLLLKRLWILAVAA
jgi:hypothetical protein